MKHIKHYLHGQALDNYNTSKLSKKVYDYRSEEYARLYEDDRFLLVKDNNGYCLYDNQKECLWSNEQWVLEDEIKSRLQHTKKIEQDSMQMKLDI